MKNYITLFLLLFTLGISTGQSPGYNEAVINGELVTLGGSYTTAEIPYYGTLALGEYTTVDNIALEALRPCAPGRAYLIVESTPSIESEWIATHTLDNVQTIAADGDYQIVAWPTERFNNHRSENIVVSAPPPGYTIEIRYVPLE